MKASWNQPRYNAAWLWDFSKSVWMHFNYWDKSISRSVFNRYELIRTTCFSLLFGYMRMFVCENSDVNAPFWGSITQQAVLVKAVQLVRKICCMIVFDLSWPTKRSCLSQVLRSTRTCFRERTIASLSWLTFDWPVFQLQSRALGVLKDLWCDKWVLGLGPWAKKGPKSTRHPLYGAKESN